MSGTTWSKFFWSDWSSDPSLRVCSLAAQGLWMRMLCVAAAHDPIGYVSIADRPLGVTDIARWAGVSETEAGALLVELERNGVFSRDRKDRIYSRRMVRDAKATAINKKNGKQGGNPEIRRGTVQKDQRVRPYRRSDSPEKTLRIFQRSGGRCHWCDCELVFKSAKLVPNLFHVDHEIPVCDGGTNDESNLVSACAKCNHARARIGWRNPRDPNSDSNPDIKPHKPEASRRVRAPKSALNPSRRVPTLSLVGSEAPDAPAEVPEVEKVDPEAFKAWAAQFTANTRNRGQA